MDEPITSADANRYFSKLLRGVREEHASYVVTSHGKAVARIVPVENDSAARQHARATLLQRLARQPALGLARISRDDLYQRGR